jgi:hypothetical protein
MGIKKVLGDKKSGDKYLYLARKSLQVTTHLLDTIKCICNYRDLQDQINVKSDFRYGILILGR